VLRLKGTPVEVSLSGSEVDGVSGEGLVARLEGRVRGLEAVHVSSVDDAARFHAEAEAARRRLGLPFDQEQTLAGLIRRQTEINEQLAVGDAASRDPAPVPGQVSAGATGTVPAELGPVTGAGGRLDQTMHTEGEARDMPTSDDPLHPEGSVDRTGGDDRPGDRTAPIPVNADDRAVWSSFLVPEPFRHVDPSLYRFESGAEPAAALEGWMAAERWADRDPEAVLVLSRAEERLRVVALPGPIAEYDQLRNDGQDPGEAMRVVAPLVTVADGTPGRVEQRLCAPPDVLPGGRGGGEVAAATAEGTGPGPLVPWASLNSSDDPTSRHPDGPGPTLDRTATRNPWSSLNSSAVAGPGGPEPVDGPAEFTDRGRGI